MKKSREVIEVWAVDSPAREGMMVSLDAQLDKEQMVRDHPKHVVGRSLPRVDIIEKVTGAARFSRDTLAPNTMALALVGSPHPHLRIHRIDVTEALQVPGVVRVITAHDLPGASTLRDSSQPYLAGLETRYQGEPMALVVARDTDAAQRATQRIHIECEQLPAITTLAEALVPGAPVIVEAEGEQPNVWKRWRYTSGNPTAAFADSDQVVEQLFTSHGQTLDLLESPSISTQIDPQDGLQIRGCTNHPYVIQDTIAHLLDLPHNRIQVIQHALRGNSQGYALRSAQLASYAALATWLTGHPVTLRLSRQASLQWFGHRPQAQINVRYGAERDGQIQACEITVHLQVGAYPHDLTPLLHRTIAHACGPYRIPHIQLEVVALATHTPPISLLPGYGQLATCFARESMLDALAQRLRIDPVLLRQINLLRPEEANMWGQPMEDIGGLSEALHAVTKAAQWSPPDEIQPEAGAEGRVSPQGAGHGRPAQPEAGAEGRQSPQGAGQGRPAQPEAGAEGGSGLPGGEQEQLDTSGAGVASTEPELSAPEGLDGSAPASGSDQEALRVEAAPGKQLTSAEEEAGSAVGSEETNHKSSPASNESLPGASFAWTGAPRRQRGWGVALAHVGLTSGGESTSPQAMASIQIQRDGTVLVNVPQIDASSDNQTRLTQITAETLAAPFEAIRILDIDTTHLPAPAPWSLPTSMFLTGQALLKAAYPLREQIVAQTAQYWGCEISEISTGVGRLFGPDEQAMTFAQAVALCWEQGLPMARFGFHSCPTHFSPAHGQMPPPEALHYPAFSYAAYFAEVEIDLDSQEIELLTLYVACDIGKVLNPMLARNQLIRGTYRGLAYTLFQAPDWQGDGVKISLCHPLHILGQVPNIHPILIEQPHSDGPLGHKGLDYLPALGIAPAVTNAIAQALGQRIHDLPFTPESFISHSNTSTSTFLLSDTAVNVGASS